MTYDQWKTDPDWNRRYYADDEEDDYDDAEDEDELVEDEDV